MSKAIGHRLWIDLERKFHSYGDPCKGRVLLLACRPLLLQSLVIRFTGVGSCSIIWVTRNSTEVREQKLDLFDDSIALVSSGEALDAGPRVWEFEFFWPRRGEADLVANYEPPTSSPPTCYFRYNLTGRAEFIDSNSAKGSISMTRSPTFVSSRASESGDPTFKYIPASFVPSFGAKLLSIIGSTKSRETLAPSEVSSSLCVVLKSPSFGITKSPLPMKMTVTPLHSGQPPTIARLKLVKFDIHLKPKLELRCEYLGAAVVATIDFEKEAALHETQSIASWSAINVWEAPSLLLNQGLDVSSRIDLRLPHLRSSFSTPIAKFSYSFKIKAEVDYLGRTFTIKWPDIPVNILPHYIQGAGDEQGEVGQQEESARARQPSFAQITPPSSLPSVSTAIPVPPRTPSPLPSYQRVAPASPPQSVQSLRSVSRRFSAGPSDPGSPEQRQTSIAESLLFPADPPEYEQPPSFEESVWSAH
jgi:hypothetical protein